MLSFDKRLDLALQNVISEAGGQLKSAVGKFEIYVREYNAPREGTNSRSIIFTRRYDDDQFNESDVRKVKWLIQAHDYDKLKHHVADLKNRTVVNVKFNGLNPSSTANREWVISLSGKKNSNKSIEINGLQFPIKREPTLPPQPAPPLPPIEPGNLRGGGAGGDDLGLLLPPTEEAPKSIRATDIFPDGFPDYENDKGQELRVELTKPVQVNEDGTEIFLPLDRFSLPEGPRLTSGGYGNVPSQGPGEERHDDKLSDAQIRRLLSALKILNDEGVEFHWVVDDVNQITGLDLNAESDPAPIKIEELADMVGEAYPQHEQAIWKNKWPGKYGDAFAGVAVQSGVTCTDFPDFAEGAVVLETKNRQNTVFILQPSDGMGYIIEKNLEFPPDGLKLHYEEAIPYFFDNIDQLMPDWKSSAEEGGHAGRPILAFRKFIKATNQGLNVGRSAESSIAILQGYVDEGTDWTTLIRNVNNLGLDSEFFESIMDPRYIASMITEDPNEILV
jgi:hypothetical protein